LNAHPNLAEIGGTSHPRKINTQRGDQHRLEQHCKVAPNNLYLKTGMALAWQNFMIAISV